MLGRFLARCGIPNPADMRIDGIAARFALQQRTNCRQPVQGPRSLIRGGARIFRQLAATRRDLPRVALNMRHDHTAHPQRRARARTVDDGHQYKSLLFRIDHDGITGHGSGSRLSSNPAGPAITSAKPSMRTLRPALWRWTSV